MPMQGRTLNAADVKPGHVVPIQTAHGGLEPRTVSSVRVEGELAYITFTDGTQWAWDRADPIVVVPPAT